MSSLVSDFLLDPVLREVRRFSRSNTIRDQVGGGTTLERIDSTQSDDGGVAIDDINDAVEDASGLETAPYLPEENIAGIPLSSSPVEEDGGLQQELRALDVSGEPSAPTTLAFPSAVPARLASLISDSGHLDDDISDNPSFGIPSRFRTSSVNSTHSFSSSTHNTTNARMSPAEGPLRSRSSTQDQSGSSNRPRGGSLPADDGMGPLRRQIIMIQALEVPAEQKARMMHRLLTQGYSHAQEIYHAKHQPRSASPSSMISQERPATPASLSSFIWQMNGSTDGDTPGQQHIFRLSADDLKRTYAPPDPLELDEEGIPIACPTEMDNVHVLGCQHYKRNVKLQCSTCEKWYTCRMCHDEAEDHVLIRKDTKNMLCMLCGSAQRAGEFCIECGERTAWYYCGVCKLWDNDPNKSIYHCNDCGICRKGRGLGKDFFHCKTCGTCMSMSVEYSHKCIERVSESDCPICGEYMFTSPHPVVFMLCGHGIHQSCYYEHMKSSYKCPICSKSTVNMETQFQNLTRAIESQPMPPQFQDTKAMVSCNDCYAKSAVKYHWLGLKCAICDSYNTAQLSILSDSSVEVPVNETGEAENALPLEQTAEEASSSTHLHPGTGPMHRRRHSSHTPTPSNTLRLAPYPQRLGRSVSPVRGPSFIEDAVIVDSFEIAGSADGEDDVNFWFRDDPRSVTPLENFEDIDMEEDEIEDDGEDDDDEDDESDDDSGSAMDECDDERDEFELFGHR